MNKHAAIALENIAGNQLVQVENSVVYRSHGQAVALKNSSNASFRSNVLAFAHGHAISISGSSSDNLIAENAVLGCSANSLLSPSDQTPAGIFATNWKNTIR